LRWESIATIPRAFFRGYNQSISSPWRAHFPRAGETVYFGYSMGFRHVFVQPGWRIQPYALAEWARDLIDSNTISFGGQGRGSGFYLQYSDARVGFDYLVNEHWKFNIGALYQHLSNARPNRPNPSLNRIRPAESALTYSF
jgi:hypothetical protein